jgi:hypothetical protein
LGQLLCFFLIFTKFALVISWNFPGGVEKF